jgi:hypothetical protein
MADIEVPADTGNIITNKLGPLPVWAWGIVILGGAYGLKLWNARKAGRGTAKTSAGYDSANLPSNVQPFYTQVNEGGSQSYVNSPVTTIGRQVLSDNAIGVQQQANAGAVGNGNTVTVPLPPGSPTTPVAAPVVAPPAPAGQWLTTVKWNPRQKNAPSTLTGLSLQAYGNAGAWQRIWNAPQNADLVRRRGSPSKIQPGDRFWAPA